ncbi:MAG: hypothetical protein ABTD50_15745 [Polyangiaceae bacterium]|jgi:hypothetical protein
MRNNTWIAWAGAGAALAAMTVPGQARAQATCADPTFPNPVYVAGSTAIQPVLQALAVQLGTQATIVYFANGSCKGLTAVLGTTTSPGPVGQGLTSVAWPLSQVDGSIQSIGGNTGYTASCSAGSTSLAGGQAIDVAFSDVYPGTCTLNASSGLPSATQKEFLGPIQAMGFWVPSSQSQSAISADAAYVVFGWAGGSYVVNPWTSAAEIWHRSTSSGTQGMIAKAIGLASSKWQGTSTGSTGELLTDLANATDPTTAIGIAAAEDLLTVPTVPSSALKMLAYQHTGQGCGYYPNATVSSRDMINVRQGRYVIWGPVHIIVNVDANGNPVDHTGQPNAALTAFMNAFIDTGPTPPQASQIDGGLSATDKQTFIAAEANAGVVPWCAMQVSRTEEIGAESSYPPLEPCGCYFETTLGATTTPCTACPTGTECTDPTTPVCRYGYCEAN